MKINYIKILGGQLVWGKEELSKEDLIRAKQLDDIIINTNKMTVYNAEENKWEDIKHD